ncbi:Mss4p nuclear export [Blyttiomyces sp. JEL0837]|nr:Mss4p nuclear export [Blyttiomyces sp. JEL0837]
MGGDRDFEDGKAIGGDGGVEIDVEDCGLMDGESDCEDCELVDGDGKDPGTGGGVETGDEQASIDEDGVNVGGGEDRIMGAVEEVMKRDRADDEHAEEEVDDTRMDEDNDDDGDNDDMEREIIDVDFDFFDPKDIDFHGLKSLLKQLFPEEIENLNMSDIAQHIIDHPEIGSIVKIDDDVGSDPYAVMTVVDLSVTPGGGDKREKPCIDAIVGYLLKKVNASSSDKKAELKGILNSKRVGLLINERVINMPPQIVPPMFKMLIEEVQWQAEEKGLKPYDYFLCYSKTYSEFETEDPETAQPGKKKKRKGTTFNFFQVEDEVFEEFSTLSIDVELSTEYDSLPQVFSESGLRPARKICLIPASKAPALLERLKAFIS